MRAALYSHSIVNAGHSASSSSSSPFLASSFCSIQANSMYDGHGLMQLPAIIITWPTIDTNSRDTEAILYSSAGQCMLGFHPLSLYLSLSLTNTNRIGPTYFPSLLIKKTEKLQPLSRLLPSLFLCAISVKKLMKMCSK